MLIVCDIDQQLLEVGDRVAYSTGGRHHDFCVGVVKGFTSKMVIVEIEKGRSWNIGEKKVCPSSLAKLFLGNEENV